MVPPSSSRPTRNSRWSGPMRMWWMPAGRNRRDDRERALARAGEVLEVPGAAAVEDRLRQRAALVDVEKRLVLRIVRETSSAVTVDRAGAGRTARSGRQLQRLPIGDDLRRRPLRRQRDAVGGHGQPAANSFDDRRRLLRRDGRIEQALGRLDVQVVPEVEDVRDERALDRVRLQAEIEIGERHRVSRRHPWNQQACRRSREEETAELAESRREICSARLGGLAARS